VRCVKKFTTKPINELMKESYLVICRHSWHIHSRNGGVGVPTPLTRVLGTETGSKDDNEEHHRMVRVRAATNSCRYS
jgi:hypothetical protein